MKNKRKNVVRRITALMLACGILFTAPWAVAQDSGGATYGGILADQIDAF